MLLSLGDLLNKAFSSVKSLVWLKCGTKKSPLLNFAVDTKCYFIKGATIITVIILSWTSAVSIIFFWGGTDFLSIVKKILNFTKV